MKNNLLQGVVCLHPGAIYRVSQKHITCLNFNKESNILVLHTLMGSLPALSFVKIMFMEMSKIVSSNKQNPMIFRTKIGLKVICQAKCFTCIWNCSIFKALNKTILSYKDIYYVHS